ncbi:MAG: hypothetical protein ACK559_30045, partial [bacterium]
MVPTSRACPRSCGSSAAVPAGVLTSITTSQAGGSAPRGTGPAYPAPASAAISAPSRPEAPCTATRTRSPA